MMVGVRGLGFRGWGLRVYVRVVVATQPPTTPHHTIGAAQRRVLINLVDRWMHHKMI